MSRVLLCWSCWPGDQGGWKFPHIFRIFTWYIVLRVLLCWLCSDLVIKVKILVLPPYTVSRICTWYIVLRVILCWSFWPSDQGEDPGLTVTPIYISYFYMIYCVKSPALLVLLNWCSSRLVFSPYIPYFTWYIVLRVVLCWTCRPGDRGLSPIYLVF